MNVIGKSEPGRRGADDEAAGIPHSSVLMDPETS